VERYTCIAEFIDGAEPAGVRNFINKRKINK
jgi:hypothetical protein